MHLKGYNLRSLIDAEDVSVHLDRVDVPGHLGLREGDHSPQMLEKPCRHLFVKVVQVRLNFPLDVFDDFDNVLCIFSHIFGESELLLDCPLLVELNIP